MISRSSRGEGGTGRTPIVPVAMFVATPVTVAVHVAQVVAVVALVALKTGIGISFRFDGDIMMSVPVRLGLPIGVSASVGFSTRVGALINVGIKLAIWVSTDSPVAESVGSDSAGQATVGKAEWVEVPIRSGSEPAKAVSIESVLEAALLHLWGSNRAPGDLPISKNLVSEATFPLEAI